MRVLWHSNAPFAGTGYGNQTQIFTELMTAAGHEVIVSCFYGLQSAALNLGKIKLLPGSRDAYGNDMLLAHVQFYKPDITIILCDAWVYDEQMLRMVSDICPLYFWAPVDHDVLPPAVLQRLAAVTGVFSMSNHGQKAMQDAGLKPTYIPHGINSELFKPMNRIEARRMLGIPSETAFLAVIVAANKGAPSRKAFDQQIRAFAAFHTQHPDSMLYLHTDILGINNGEDLKRLLDLSGLPREAVAVCGQYQYHNGMFQTDYMNAIYNAADVLLNATRGEGFGIPIVEAQMAGCPVIVTDCTAMSEHVYLDVGYKVEYVDKIFTLQGAYQYIPSVTGITGALNSAYIARPTVDRISIQESVKRYDSETVYNKYMSPALEAAIKPKNNDELVIIPPKPIAPDISVVMPVFNGIETIDKAIKSVLHDQWANLELIIIDDCSTDGTWKHLRQYRKDSRVKTFKMKTGGGPVGALNLATNHIAGKYVIKLDADDWFEFNALEKLQDILDKNDNVGFAYGGCQYHGTMNIKHEPPPYDKDKFNERNMAIGEPMYRVSAHMKHRLKHRGFWVKDKRWFGPHDWDLMLQMINTLGWVGQSTTELIHHYNHQPTTASAETKKRSDTVMAAFRKQWPQVTAKGI